MTKSATVANAKETARFAIRNAIANTAHLTRLNADNKGIESLVNSIMDEIEGTACGWAFEIFVNGKAENADYSKTTATAE